MNIPLLYDDVSPTDDESLASFTRRPWGDWFDDYDPEPERLELEIPANQTDDDGTDE